MMRLGLGSYACAWAIAKGKLDAVGVIQSARELGLRVVQLADNIRLENAPPLHIDAIRTAAHQANVDLELGTRGFDPRHLRRLLQLCKTLDVHLLRVIADNSNHACQPEEVIEALGEISTELQESGVVVAIENHDHLPARSLAHIVSRIDSPAVGVCLDTVNSFGALEGPEYVVEILGSYAVNLHVKDFKITREPHNMGFRITGTPAGRGALDVPWLLERLRSLGARGNAILELWPSPEADTESTVAKEMRWREESVRYLRTFLPD